MATGPEQDWKRHGGERGHRSSGFQLGLLAKDVKIAADLAEDLQAHAPLAQMSRDLLARAADRIGGDADHSATIQYWEMLNGVTVGNGEG